MIEFDVVTLGCSLGVGQTPPLVDGKVRSAVEPVVHLDGSSIHWNGKLLVAFQ